MKSNSALKESLRLYKDNFGPLCLTLLVQLVLRAMALTPLLFLLGSIWGSQKAARVKNPDNEQEGSDGTQ